MLATELLCTVLNIFMNIYKIIIQENFLLDDAEITTTVPCIICGGDFMNEELLIKHLELCGNEPAADDNSVPVSKYLYHFYHFFLFSYTGCP